MMRIFGTFGWIIFGLSFAFGQSAPFISSVSPLIAAPTETVTISGSTLGSSEVYFGSTKGTILSNSSGLIEVKVPAGASYGPITVININGVAVSSSFFLPNWNGNISTDTDYPFASVQNIAVNEQFIYDLCLCDFDDDGLNDVVVTSGQNKDATSAERIIFRNTSATAGGTSSFVKALSLGSQPALHVECGDLDGDGKPDLVVTQTSEGSETRNVEVYLNTSTTGNISFDEDNVLELILNRRDTLIRPPAEIAIDDLNQDGKLDLVISSNQYNDVDVFQNTSTTGSLSFESPLLLSLGTELAARGIQIADLNNNNLPEIIVGAFAGSDLFYFENISTSEGLNFKDETKLISLERDEIRAIEISDLDGDGFLEIIASEGSSSSGELMILPNNTSEAGGSIEMGVRVEVPTDLFPWGLAVGDLNGDGKPDIATGILESGKTGINVFFNSSSAEGNFSFDKQSVEMNLNNNRNLRISDFNNDGKPDLAVTSKSAINTSGILSIVENAGCLTPVIAPVTSSYCTGVEFFVTASTSAGTTYSWEISIDDGSTYSVNGTSTQNKLDISSYITDIKVRVTAAIGSCSLTSDVVEVTSSSSSDPGTPVIEVSPTTVCLGSAFVLSSTLSADNYNWTGPNDFTSIEASPSFEAASSLMAGTYSLTISNTGGCAGQTATKILEIDMGPPSTIVNNGDDLFCEGLTTELAISTYPGFTYQWNRGGIAIAGETSGTYDANTTGVYSVTTIETATTCEATGEPYTITQVIKPTFTITGVTATCVELDRLFEATIDSTNTAYTNTYCWSYTNPADMTTDSTSMIASDTLSFSEAGVYSVKLSTGYQEVANCESEVNQLVVVTTIPTLTIDASDGVEKCPSDSLPLALPIDLASYFWSNGDTTYNTYGVIDLASETNPKDLSVMWVNSVGCADTSFITINNYYDSNIEITSSAGEITEGLLTVPEPTGWLTNIPLSANGGSDYLWEPTNIVSDSNGIEVNIYPKSIYELVTLSGNDANGCYESDTVRMSIDFVAPRKSFSPNGDGYGFDCWEIRNAVDMIDCTVYIFNELGKEIWSGSQFVDDCIWDGNTYSSSEAPEGIYYYIISCDETQIFQPSGAILLAR